jgi:hypothetical protein
VLFFWERVNVLQFSHIQKLIDLNVFDKVYFMQRNDGHRKCPHHSTLNLPSNVVVIDEWLSKEKYDKIMNKCNIAVAPRLNEGIGHGFLDFLKRGMCVLANNDFTHCEYIENDVSGILFDVNVIKKIDFKSIDWRKLGREARESVGIGFDAWQVDKEKLLQWVEL